MPSWRSASRSSQNSLVFLKGGLLMSIVDVQWHPYRIPLRTTFNTAHGALTIREGAIVEVMTSEGINGVGEIAPLPIFSGDTLHDALVVLPSLVAHMRGQSLSAALAWLYKQQEQVSLSSAAVCGLECALLDAQSKLQGCSMSTLLATEHVCPRESVQVNAVIGTSTIATAVDYAREALERGFTCIKLKMGTGLHEEIERVAALREAIGPHIRLRLDANESWSFEQAVTILNACAPFAIEYVEQPLRAYDLIGMYQLRQVVPVPIAADEALYNLASARRILTWEAADVLIIKPQLTGGLRAARQIIQEATTRAVQCVITSVLETGIGLAATLHLAAATHDITLACGLATLPLLANDLLLDDIVMQQGSLTVPTGPGLGIQLDRDAHHFCVGEKKP